MPDPHRPKGAPVHLGLFAGDGDHPAIDGGGGLRPEAPHEPPDGHGGAEIAALAEHFVQPRGAQAAILRQGVPEEGQNGSSALGRLTPRRTPPVSRHTAARTVSWWTPRAAAIVPIFQCSPK